MGNAPFTARRFKVGPQPRTERTGDKWCKQCGCKRRGKNHDAGIHHKTRAGIK